MPTMPNQLKEILPPDNLSSILESPIRDQSHPVKWLLQNEGAGERQELVNTNTALRHILKTDPTWVNRQVPRLCDTENYENAAGALGEIRAYGYMLEAGIRVRPIPEDNAESTPDYEIEDGLAQVEVNAKQIHGAMASDLERFNQGHPGSEDELSITRVSGQTGLTTRIIVVDPCGRPASGENITENVISKICGIKRNETQFSSLRTSILWVDFQGEHWHLHTMVDQASPINSWNGEFYSGAIWYALYGWRGAPIFEHAGPDGSSPGSIVRMRHDGRYRLASKVDATIFSCPRHTILLENQNSTKRINEDLLKKIICLPWFRFESSYTRWPVDNLAQMIDLQRHSIENLRTQIERD